MTEQACVKKKKRRKEKKEEESLHNATRSFGFRKKTTYLVIHICIEVLDPYDETRDVS